MKQERVNVKVIPDIRRLNTGCRFPLKLRITYKGIRKYYSTGYEATNEEWDIINTAEAKGNLRKIKNSIAAIEIEAQKCCELISPFSFSYFEQKFFAQKIQFETLEAAYNEYIRQLRANQQYGSADIYQTAIHSLLKYKKRISFGEITKEFLQGYENWLLANGKSITTVGIHGRTIRCIMNIAMEKGVINPDAYPFGKRKYVIPTGKNVKKALGLQQIKQIFEYIPMPGTGMEKARDFWIFSYLCNGMNMMDICQLQWKDLHSSHITFIREKTKRQTKANPIIITVPRNAHIDRIIQKWGTQRGGADDYIFDVVQKGDSYELIRAKIKQFTHVTNDWTKRIGQDLQFEMKLTTYVARHSFATILVQSGAPMKLASISLGHQSLTTTEKYFAGFDLGVQAEYAKALVNF